MAQRVKNIGPEGQRTRLKGGLIALASGIVGAVALVLRCQPLVAAAAVVSPLLAGGAGRVPGPEQDLSITWRRAVCATWMVGRKRSRIRRSWPRYGVKSCGCILSQCWAASR